MSFSTLLGNARLRENLERSIQRGHISHFYLITGPKGSGKHTLAKLLAAAILCRENDPPCFGCQSCRKVMDGNHPDFITVDDPEKKTVPVDLIRGARADIYIRPNESEYKVYLFPRAQDMGLPGQNALLKVLEEPPEYVVFLLLADNPEKLLPTVRSRCTELPLLPLPEKTLISALAERFPKAVREALSGAACASGGYLGQAMELLENGLTQPPQTAAMAKALADGDAMALMEVLVPMEKWKRDDLIPMLQSWRELVENALACRGGGAAVSDTARLLASRRTGQELYKMLMCFQKAADYAASNVSPAAVCGYLEWSVF